MIPRVRQHTIPRVRHQTIPPVHNYMILPNVYGRWTLGKRKRHLSLMDISVLRRFRYGSGDPRVSDTRNAGDTDWSYSYLVG